MLEPRHIVDLALGLLVVEALLLWAVGRSRRTSLLASMAPTLFSGGFLLLALRAALAGQPTTWILAALTGGLVAHLADLRRRAREPATSSDLA